MLREAAAMTTQISGEIIPSDKPGCIAMAIRQPAGVVLGIAPWNAPVILGIRAIAMPLACGNTVVLKASEICPRHAPADRRCLRRGRPAAGRHQCHHQRAGGCAGVGRSADRPSRPCAASTSPARPRVGRIIARPRAKYLKPVLLELGGKAPLLVLDDADLDAAVAAAAFGAFMNQGQICMSTERIVVDDKIADAFVAKLAAKAAHAGGRRSAQGQHRRSGSLISVEAADADRRA